MDYDNESKEISLPVKNKLWPHIPPHLTPLHLASPASPSPLRACVALITPHTLGSSVVGTTSSAVAPFTPALPPLQFLRGTGAPHRPALPRQGRRNELVLRRSRRTTVSVLCFADTQTPAPVCCFTKSPSSVSDSPTRSPDHGGEKWPVEFPRERGSQ